MNGLNLDSLSVLLFCSDLLVDVTDPVTKAEWLKIEHALNVQHNSPASLFGLNKVALMITYGLDEYVVLKILNRMNKLPMLLHTINALSHQQICICTKYEAYYPKNLRRLKTNMPLYFYYSGQLKFNEIVISIEGDNLAKKQDEISDLLFNKMNQRNYSLLLSNQYSYLFKHALRHLSHSFLYVKRDLLGIVELLHRYIENDRLTIISLTNPYNYQSTLEIQEHYRLLLTLSDYQIVVRSDINDSPFWNINCENARKQYAKQLVLYDENLGGNKQLIQMGLVPFTFDDLSSVLSIDFIYEKNESSSKESNQITADQLDIFDFLDEDEYKN